MSILKKKAVQIFILPLFLYAFCPKFAAGQTSSEYHIKAAYLYNFTQFITWPEQTFTPRDQTLIIGVYGENPFNGFLENVVRGEKAKGRTIQVRYINSVEDLNACHVLYIGTYNRKEIKELLSECHNRNILTVSDSENFIKLGGMVRFVTVNNNVKFQINPIVVENAGLKISSKVLRLAEIVVEKPN